MTSQPDRTGALTEAECRELLTTAPVGRVVLADEADPVALPVNYTVVGPEIYFRTGPGRKLAAAAAGRTMGLQADRIADDLRSGWSVLAVGPSRVVTDPAEVALLDAAGLTSWAHPEPVGPGGTGPVPAATDAATGETDGDGPASEPAEPTTGPVRYVSIRIDRISGRRLSSDRTGIGPGSTAG